VAKTARPETRPHPVNSGMSFTGNSAAFAEYRVNTLTVSLNIPP
jgi:hypothetical protein